MNLKEFIDKLIRDGIEEVTAVYADQPNKMKGAIAGFKACEFKTPTELALELKKAQGMAQLHFTTANHDKYWYHRMRQLQIEFVCNVVSAVLQNERKPIIIAPTARGVMKAAEILDWGSTNERA